MKRSRALLAALVVTAALAATGCGFGGSGAIESAGSWERLPDPPLTPREHSIGVSAGREVLILGGSDAPPTHPSSSGPGESRPPLRDGAAFDPRKRAWRRIADAPIGIDVFAPITVVRRTVYIAVPRTVRRDTRMDLVAYAIDSDRWRRLRSPPRRNYRLVRAGRRLVAAGPDRGPVPMSLFVLRKGRRGWERLPDAPFRGSLVWHRGRLVLIGFDPAARNPDNPALARTATLRLGDRDWRRLPDSDHVMWGHGFWVPVGGRLVSPDLGTGSEDYDHGRPYGGILDPERGTWSELPNIPEPTEERGAEFGTGVLTRNRLVGGLPELLVLDVTREDWIRIPAIWSDRRAPLGFTTANVSRKLLVFGGGRFTKRHPEGELLNDAWLWTPPPAG